MSSMRLLLTSILLSISLVSPGLYGEITTQDLTVTDEKIRSLVKRAMPATVALIPAVSRGRSGTGSGVIVSEDGLILTAAHVSMVMRGNVIVIFPDGRRVKGKVLGMDYSRDSGMVQITEPGKYPYIELGDSKSLNKNDWTIALGNAGGWQHDRKPPIRLGRVLQNNPKSFLRTDSALISGDSGGPLFDINGKLIGIHSNIGMSLSQNNHVPISTYKENWEKLKSGKRFGGDIAGALVDPELPMIGAVLTDLPGRPGALIKSVMSNSPAEKGGLKKGDLVIKSHGRSIKDSDALVAEIHKKRPGEIIRLTVASGTIEKTVRIRLTSATRLKNRTERTPPKRTPEETRKLQEEFNHTMRRSIREGTLHLTDDDYDKFHGPEDFNAFMNRFKKSLSKSELKTLVKIATPTKPVPVRPNTYDPDKAIQVNEKFFREVLDAFRPSAGNASDATHLVFRGQEWKSLCTVVHPDGYAITKASEIDTGNNQKLGVLLAKGKFASAKVIKIWHRHDLALIKVKTSHSIPSVDLKSTGITLPPGSVISAPGTGPDPIAIGLISVPARSLSSDNWNKGFLGIGTAPDRRGVRINMVMDGASADLAGLLKGDVITKIGRVVCNSQDKLINEISSKKPGTDVVIQLLREGRGMSVKVTLGDRKMLDELVPDPSGKMNTMGTEVSDIRTGFPSIIQTDLPIEPRQCGGPVVDLRGNVIGINIARAGRIKTFMIPAEEVHRLVAPSLPQLTTSTQ